MFASLSQRVHARPLWNAIEQVVQAVDADGIGVDRVVLGPSEVQIRRHAQGLQEEGDQHYDCDVERKRQQSYVDAYRCVDSRLVQWPVGTAEMRLDHRAAK